MEFGKGVFEVKSTSGDTQLGGTDMDRRVFDYQLERFQSQSGLDIRADRLALARLKEAAEIAKIELTTSTTTHITLPFIAAKAGVPQHLEMDFTRVELERLVAPVIERCRAPVEQALADAHITPKDIDRVVFVGGPTRMPAVRRFFEELLGRKAEMGVDPMECVAAGAAIQAGVLAGEAGLGEIVLVDVTPLTLGVETLGGVATPLIARNTPIPVKHSESFTTAADMQTSVTIHVYQGERAMAADNTSLGEFNLGGIPPAPRGIPKIDVTFDIDTNGILNVTARDQVTAKSASISISGSTRLAEGEKERMVKEAERYAEDDRKRREAAQKLNEADAACYEAEKMLAEFSDKLTAEVRKKIEDALKYTREALVKKDAPLAAERAEVLKKALKEGGTILYAQSPGAYKAPSGPQPPPTVGEASGEARPSGPGPRGRVVDADYKETGQA
jgi:molecular chaperone DnaK